MLKEAGYNCKIVVGKGYSASEHNWVIVETSPGVWRHMDTERQGIKVYLATDAELEAWDKKNLKGVRYQWDRSKYPEAK